MTTPKLSLDHERVSNITRLISAKGSRRAAIAALLGAVVIGEESAATRAKHNKPKPKRRHQQHRRTRRKNAQASGFCGPECGECQRCRDGACVDRDGGTCDFLGSYPGRCVGSTCEFDSLTNDPAPVQEFLSFGDLKDLGSSPDAVRQKFTEYFNSQPQGLALNSETYFAAVKPPITEQYGHPCYKVVGNFVYQVPTISPDDQRVVALSWAVNNTDEEQDVAVTLSGSRSKSTTVTWQQDVGLKVTAEVTAKEIFKFGGEISVTESVGKQWSQSEDVSVSTTVTVKVPPRSKRKVTIVGTHRQESVNFQAPISVWGYFGANYDHRVRDHYYWFLSSNLVLPQSSGTIRGTLKHADVYELHTQIDVAESIS